MSFLEPWSLLRGKKSVVLSSLIIAGGGGQATGRARRQGRRGRARRTIFDVADYDARVEPLSEASLSLRRREGGMAVVVSIRMYHKTGQRTGTEEEAQQLV